MKYEARIVSADPYTSDWGGYRFWCGLAFGMWVSFSYLEPEVWVDLLISLDLNGWFLGNSG